MKTRTLFLIYYVCLANCFTAAELAPWVGPNILPGPDPDALPAGEGKNQAEPHVIRSVSDPDLILTTFQDGRYSDGGARGNGYAVSEDGGFSWRRALNPRLTQVSGGPYYRATDPVGGISHDGILYLNSLVSVDANFNQGRLVVQRSMDRGLTWTDPIHIYTGYFRSGNDNIFPDKNWMAVDDYPDSPHPGRIVVTWTNFRTITEGSDNIEDYLITASYSDTQGDSWSSARYVTPPSSPNNSLLKYQGSQPVFLPGGGLAIVYHNFLAQRLEVAYSADGGVNFPYSPTPVHSRYYLFDLPNFRDGSFLPSAAVARESGDLYITYTSRPTSGSSRAYIYFSRSRRPDPGTSPAANPDWNFSEPIQISGTLPIREVANPVISVSPDGQLVTVYFFDNRFDPGNNIMGDFYGVQSSNGGATWSEPFRLSPESFDLRSATNTNRGYMIGDYFGLASPAGPDQASVAVWVDTASPTADPRATRIGGFTTSVFAGWLEAWTPYFMRQAPSANLRYSDGDLDGTPFLLEYIMDLSPTATDRLPDIENGLRHLRLADATDPETQVQVRVGAGDWPHQQVVVSSNPAEQPVAAGYWVEATWNVGQAIDHLEIVINGDERWFLLDESAALRWVRAFPDAWIRSPWFGYLYAGYAPWVYHLSLGWLYEQRGMSGGYFFSAALGAYLYVYPDTYPLIVTDDLRYYYVLEGSPWLYDYAAGQWVRVD